MEDKKEIFEENDKKIDIEADSLENSSLTEKEREELELLRKKEELRKAKPFNIYDRIDVSPRTLSIVIVIGCAVIVGAIVLGLLAR